MFLAPLFLIAAALGAAVPLVLHVMQNQRKDLVPFPTLRFLKMADRNSSRRLRLENILLWLLRTLIMLLLGFAFALPMLRSQGLGWLGNAPRDVAIVLDSSFSMGYNTGRETVWETAIKAATSVISGLGENDRFCIYLAGENPEPVIAQLTSNQEDGINRLQALQAGTGASRLERAAVAAIRILEQASGNRERELHIITDNQLLPWLGFDVSQATSADGEEEAAEDSAESGGEGAVSSGWDPKRLEQTAVFVSLLGVPAPENIAPSLVELQPNLLREDVAGELKVTLSRSGRTPRTSVALYLNDEQISRRSIELDGPDGLNPSFRLPPLPRGVHAARIETPDDNLPIDNVFHFLLHVAEDNTPLVVGSPEDTFFVRVALRTGSGTAPEVIAPEALTGQNLSQYPAIFLCNALPLSGQAIQALEQYARTGGLLVIFPGMKASSEDYAAWSCLPAKPSGIEDLPTSMRARTLVWDRPQHPIIQPLQAGLTVPSITVRRVLRWEEPYESTERLISMGSGQSFLLERPFGEGRVLLFAVSADRTWSDLPLSPYYLPVVLQTAEYGASMMAKKPFFWATDAFSVSDNLPEAREDSTLFGPNARPVSIRSRISSGRSVFMVENLTTPGIYRLATSENPDPRPALAVNLIRTESDLIPISPEEVSQRMDLPSVIVARDLEDLRRLLDEHRIGRTFSEHFLWLALLLIVIEFLYANFLLRRGPSLSEQLHVDLSGAVKGHVSSTPAPVHGS